VFGSGDKEHLDSVWTTNWYWLLKECPFEGSGSSRRMYGHSVYKMAWELLFYL